MKDLTARTTLISTLYQSTHAAGESCAEHAQIVAALEAGDLPLAIAQLRRHIGSVADHLGQVTAAEDPLASLRAALSSRKAAAPPAIPAISATPADALQAASAPTRRPRRSRLFTDLIPPATPPSPNPTET